MWPFNKSITVMEISKEDLTHLQKQKENYHIKKDAIKGAVIIYLNIPKEELNTLPKCIKPMWRIGKRLWNNHTIRKYLKSSPYWLKNQENNNG